MEKDNNKELINHIVDRLKQVDELPYKEGAWEKFNQQYNQGSKKQVIPYYWMASAAAVLIIAIFGIQQFQKEADVDVYSSINVEEKNNQLLEDREPLAQVGEGTGRSAPELSQEVNSNKHSLENALVPDQRTLSMLAEIPQSNTSVEFSADKRRDAVIAFQPLQAIKQVEVNNAMPKDLDYPMEVYSSLSYAAIQNNTIAQVGQSDLELNNKKFQFNERFDLGMFVSPNTTNDKVNFGGGLLLGYKLNKHLTVRTGLSFNKYEVGKLKDPVSNEENQVVLSKDAIQEVVTNGLMQRVPTNALILPNMNAISGNIQSLEIPLEFKLNSKSGFYATSGLTYAMVLDQDRLVHYIDNSNTEVFPGGVLNSEGNQELAVKPVSKTIKTSDKNVKTSGFGGFVNLSVGKDVKVNKTMSVSVEPYMKLPVGNFRAADMNYTHGGIRIITNF